MKRLIGVVVSLALSGIGHAASAQSSPAASALSAKDQRAQELVVSIRASWKEAAYAEEAGAGVIVAVTASAIYVATARHVVAQPEDGPGTSRILRAADSVWVRLFRVNAPVLATVIDVESALMAAGQQRLRAAAGNPDAMRRIAAELVSDSTRVVRFDYDLAVVRIARDVPPLAGWTPPVLDRLGDVPAMRRGDDVTAIGCPGSDCWRVPARGDQYLDYPGVRRSPTEFQGGKLTFQTQQVGQGNSGGALFNEDREVIGVVTDVKWPLGYALPIDDVVNLLVRSGVPVDLRRPRFPRDGYHMMVDLELLMPLNAAAIADSLVTDFRVPSARLVFSKRAVSSLTWHVGVLRLAPYNTSLHAAMGGLGFTQRIGRVSLKPFAELGFGQVKSRYDAGGYYRLPSGVTALPSESAAFYVPLWVSERASSPGVGAGMYAEFLVAPHVSLTANLARWTFGLTPKGPALPGAFLGGGLRWNR